jgi:SAM-dependent methyltransferase
VKPPLRRSTKLVVPTGKERIMSTEITAGSAGVQGRLWGARGRDWAELQEPAQAELYPPVLAAAGVGPGTRLLDVGCGSGVAAAIARAQGATVSGIDAARPAVECARARVTDGDFAVGEMEALPWPDGAFDVVTSFCAFQYAADPVAAVRETRRVLRVGGSLAIVTWGPPEACGTARFIGALGALLPPPPPGAPGPFALSAPGALEALAAAAGLDPTGGGEVRTTWHYPDRETLVRASLSSGPSARAIEVAGEERVAEAAVEAHMPFRRDAGAYAVPNVWRYVVAVAA